MAAEPMDPADADAGPDPHLGLGAGGSHTLPSEARDFPEWRQGRTHYTLWAVALDGEPAVRQRLARLRAALAPLLLPGDRRQPHLTLQLCGFAVAAPRRPDDFGPAQLQAQAAAVARLAPPPFTLHVGSAFSFASAACLAVHDPSGQLARLRAAWSRAAPSPDATPYLPHVTAGLYRGAWPLRDVRARLAGLAALPAIALTVRTLAWMAYDAARVGGPLRTLLRVDLASGHTEVGDDAALRAVFGG